MYLRPEVFRSSRPCFCLSVDICATSREVPGSVAYWYLQDNEFEAFRFSTAWSLEHIHDWADLLIDIQIHMEDALTGWAHSVRWMRVVPGRAARVFRLVVVVVHCVCLPYAHTHGWIASNRRPLCEPCRAISNIIIMQALACRMPFIMQAMSSTAQYLLYRCWLWSDFI